MAETGLIGKTILGYTVDRKIGSGGFGTVYRVTKQNASGTYLRALKHITLPTQKQYDAVLYSMGGDYAKAESYFAKALQDIVGEIKILNALTEMGAENIVRCYENDIVETKEPHHYDIYILMEYLTPFPDFLAGSRLTREDAVNFGLDILSALAVCHKNGIIHRDIKEDNIFVTDARRYKLGDFGVSKVLKEKARAESIKGTPDYIAPEVYLGRESYTKSVDLYSLGIVLYKLFNDQRGPFLPQSPALYDMEDEDRAFERRMKGDAPPPPVNCGEALGKVIAKALSGPENRYRSAEEFYQALLDAKNGMTADELGGIIHLPVSAKNTGTIAGASSAKDYRETVAQDASPQLAAESQREDLDKAYQKNLFLTVGAGDTPPAVPPQYARFPVPPERSPAPAEKQEPGAGTGNRRLVFVLPFLIALAGAVVFYVVLPIVYGRMVSFLDWLFGDPENIIRTLRDPGRVLPHFYAILLLRACAFVLSAALIASLFFAGRELQRKKAPGAAGALLKGKEAYFLAMDVSAELAQTRRRLKTQDFGEVPDKIRLLDEKLMYESDFGYGGEAVTGCENEIAQRLSSLQNMLKELPGNDTFPEKLERVGESADRISELMTRRTEMMKKTGGRL